MARRIALPSSAELFSDAAPYAAARPSRPAGTDGEPPPAESPTPPVRSRPRRAAAAAAERPATAAGRAGQRRTRATSRPAAETVATPPAVSAAVTAPTPRPRRRPPTGASAWIDDVESRLRDLPIDSLLTLRDGLEGLLLEGAVTEADVERVRADW